MAEKRVEGEWRCSACGDGGNLSAWAAANVCGPIDAHGEVIGEEFSEQFELYESSVQCKVHMESAALERWFDGKWCRLVRCTDCDGTGKGKQNLWASSPGRRAFYKCGYCKGEGWRWLPQEVVDRHPALQPSTDSQGEAG